jgi:hypothetical protein
MEDDEAPPGGTPPQSLMPYETWTEEGQRLVMQRALAFAAANGLPGAHHFYITFRTTAPGVSIPPRLLAQYPQEMTIVLQHQFWDLKVDEARQCFSVGLSFSGVPSPLVIPFGAVVAFADPQVRFGMRLNPRPAAADPVPAAASPPPEPAAAPAEEKPQVVSLDAFRRRAPPKE